MIGADVGRLRALASEFTAAADRIDAELRAVTTTVRNTPWQGASADRFRHSWTSVHSTRLRSLANQLRDAARILRTNADDQQHVSNAGASSHRPGGGLAQLMARGLLPVGGIGLTIDRSKLHWNDIVEGLEDLKDIIDVSSPDDIAHLLRAFGKMNELPLLQIRGLPVLDLAFDGASAAYWVSAEGISDARSWDPLADAGLTLGAMGVAVAMFGTAAAAPAAAALGLGGVIGTGIDHAVGLLPGEKKLTDRWAEAALGTPDFELRSAATEIHQGMSPQELQRRADEANKLASEARKKTEKTKTPWGCLELMFSI